MSDVETPKGQLLTTGWKIAIVTSFIMAGVGSGYGSTEQQRLRNEIHKQDLQIKSLENKVKQLDTSINFWKKQDANKPPGK